MEEGVAGGLDTASREFYEFVLPPIDIIEDDEGLIVTIDLPGFRKDRISIAIKDNILEILAARESPQASGVVIYQHHRPLKIHKKIPLPVATKAKGGKAEYIDGVLTLRIPVVESNRIDIT